MGRTGDNHPGGVTYTDRDASYFDKRRLDRHANVIHLWALGVGAVISGHFSGWNIGLLSGGWGGMLIATALIAIMYFCLTFAIAEMSPALPHTGAAYSFARTTMGPWGGFVTGLAENVEYVLAPAAIVFFISAYLTGIFETPVALMPLWWIGIYALFLALNIFGAALSFRVTLIVTMLALTCLVIFWMSALPNVDFTGWALNIGAGGTLLDQGDGPFLPNGLGGVFATLPFAVWLFLAIEELPLAAEESIDPRRDMPGGILAGMVTLTVSAFMIVLLNPAVIGVGSYELGNSGEPLLDGFRAIFGESIGKGLALVAVVGLIASLHTVIFAQGRQIYSLSRAGYFPTFLSVTHEKYKTPHIAMVSGALLGLGVLLSLWFLLGAETGGNVIGGTLLNMVVFGAMLSYISQMLAFILLRRNHPGLERPFRNPLGIPGAVVAIAIAIVTLAYQVTDPVYRQGIIWVAVWFAIFSAYFALRGRHRLVLSPEEAFALAHTKRANT